MRNISRNDDEFVNSKKTHDVPHIIISGHPVDTLDPEEMDIYRFMIGGLQAK
ncbi:MAG: hypothetical protein ACT6FE_07770 [Methanosarcinaceae archaeon]